MARLSKSLEDASFLAAAMEGLELQRERIDTQIRRVRALLGGRKPKAAVAAPAADKPAKRRRLSAAARKRISLAQKRRWAEHRKQSAAAK